MDKTQLSSVLETNLSRQLGWIAASDSKAAFGFAVATGMLGIVSSRIPLAPCHWTLLGAVSTSIAGVLCATALMAIAFATFPRTSGPKGSLLFFGGICQRNVEQYRHAVQALSVEEYIADLADQCHRNAELASIKFTWIQRASMCLLCAAPFWVAALWSLPTTNP